ncbi:Fic family protein [Algoriphagus zhangzhouensis]|uniref:Fic family protein n=1 Tax=Algoriphagus zhangzhouensis TaxID=1073327 RepID=A0A1M7ZBG0_9BACT|nr:Fic family protein [Algoriphagus zhangzhouensis]TDY46838.1 Fic family protein [Algoriphagus zhangzhouensis]SHO62203.1 Fic family protein [Algoriphagus zhangzhouensis]
MKKFISGKYINQGSYKSFQPDKIGREWKVENMELIQLLSQADRQLGRLDMYSEYIPNIDLFISMHVLKEATQSSKIEGTKTNIEEALLDKDDISEEKRDDWEEVQNYIKALNQAILKLNDLPFSSRLIKQTHEILLSGVRGKHKLPGEFRTSQNWIGGAGISDAIFVPPIHSSIGEYMGDLENFVHNDEYFFPELLKIALVHYQFETIHPFLDGNGRVGRLMITLYLVEKGILKKPILYLSDFFEKNRTLYYDNLMRVREKNDILQWFKFFLVGVVETAKSSIQTFDSILKLQKQVDAKIQTLGSRSSNANLLIQYLYQHPILDSQKAKELTGLSFPSVYKLLEELETQQILKEMTGGKRGKIYLFKDYINLFNSKE